MVGLRRIAFALLVAVAHLGFAPAFAGPTAYSTGQIEPARVRFVAAALDAPGLNAYTDGTLSVTAIDETAGYIEVLPGEHIFSFRPAGSSIDSAAVTTSVDAGQTLTIAAIGPAADLQALVIFDDLSAPARNTARLTIVHAASDAPPVTVQVNGTPMSAELNYLDVSEPAQVTAGTVDLTVPTADGAPVVEQLDQVFAADHAYTAFVMGAVDTYRLLILEAATNAPLSHTQFRFANMTPDMGALRVYVNGEPAPLFPQVPFSSITNAVVTGQGHHVIEVYALDAGPESGPPLASGAAHIGPHESIIFVAQGSTQHMEIAAYSNDLSPLPPASARLQIINLALDDPTLQVARMEGDILFDSVGTFDAASRIVPAGSYNLRFTNPASGAVKMEQSGISLLAGTATALFVIDLDPVDPWVDAIPLTVDDVPQHASVRWAHFSQAAPPVDFYVGNAPSIAAVGYKTVTNYQLIEPGLVTMAAYPAGADPAVTDPLATLSIELTGDSFPRTVYLYGTADAVRFGVAPESLELLPHDRARIRFINAAINSGAVAIANPTDGTRAVTDLQFGQASVNATVAAGVYTFNFVRDEGPIAAIQGVEFEAGNNYTIVLAGVYLDEPGLETLVVETSPLE